MTVREYPLRILMTHVRFCVVNTDPAASYNDDIFVLGRKISVISAEHLFISSFKEVGAYCFTNVGLSVCPSDGRPGSFRYYLKNCLSQSFYNYFICRFILVRTRSLFILFSLCQRSMWYRSLLGKKLFSRIITRTICHSVYVFHMWTCLGGHMNLIDLVFTR